MKLDNRCNEVLPTYSCCLSVNQLCYEDKPRFCLEKKTENNIKRQTYNMLKNVKTKLEMYATGP